MHIDTPVFFCIKIFTIPFGEVVPEWSEYRISERGTWTRVPAFKSLFAQILRLLSSRIKSHTCRPDTLLSIAASVKRSTGGPHGPFRGFIINTGAAQHRLGLTTNVTIMIRKYALTAKKGEGTVPASDITYNWLLNVSQRLLWCFLCWRWRKGLTTNQG